MAVKLIDCGFYREMADRNGIHMGLMRGLNPIGMAFPKDSWPSLVRVSGGYIAT